MMLIYVILVQHNLDDYLHTHPKAFKTYFDAYHEMKKLQQDDSINYFIDKVYLNMEDD